MWIFGVWFWRLSLAHSMFHVHFCFREIISFVKHVFHPLFLCSLRPDVQSVFVVRWYIVSCFVTLTQFFLSLWLSFIRSLSRSVFRFQYFDYYSFVYSVVFLGVFSFGSHCGKCEFSIFTQFNFDSFAWWRVYERKQPSNECVYVWCLCVCVWLNECLCIGSIIENIQYLSITKSKTQNW